MRERLPIALVLVLVVIFLAGCRALNNPAPTPPPAVTPVRPAETPSGKPLIVPGIPGLYLAWGSAVNAVPPTREPGDPLAPGNEVLGVDCISYLGSGGDLVVTPACPENLPTSAIKPAATPGPGSDLLSRQVNRQARRLHPARSLRITVSSDWQASRTENIAAGNLLAAGTFMQIVCDGTGPEHLHEVYVEVPEAVLMRAETPTTAPMARPTTTSAPSATKTPLATVTPGPGATAVPSATPSPMPTSACPPRPLGSLALSGPRALAAGPGGFYAALFETSEVAGFTADTRVRTWQGASGPGRTNGLAIWGDTLIASNRDTGTVTLHRAATGERLSTIPVGGLPWGVGAGEGPAGTGAAYVANFADDSVSVIDLATRQRVATTAVSPMPVTALPAGGEVYVLHLDGVLTRLDLAGRVLGQSSTGLADTRGITYDPLRKRLYIGSESGAIVAISLPTLAPVRRYTLPGPAYAVALNEGTGRIFTVDAQGDQLFSVDPDSGSVDVLPLLDQGDAQGGQGLAAHGNRIAVSNFASNSVSFFDDGSCAALLTPPAGGSAPQTLSATPARTAVQTFTATPTRTPTLRPTSTRTATPVAPSTVTRTPTSTRTALPATPTNSPTPLTVRAKVEIVWPHGGAGVEDADLANITAYLLSGDGTQGARTLLDSVPCDWEPTVRLWSALNNQPARLVGAGQKRMVTGGGRSFPAWDFNDVNVRPARDPANKLSFYITVEDGGTPVRALHNVWVHAVDARTQFPQQDVPTSVTRVRPSALDAKIQIVWPHDNLPVQEAQRANITAYLFTVGTQQALSPDIAAATDWTPVVRLHFSLNNEPEAAPSASAGGGIVGVPRVVTGANGVKFLAWDFNDVDVRLANDPLNRLYYWVSVDDVPTFSSLWAHGADARTLFPQPDVLNSCN